MARQGAARRPPAGSPGWRLGRLRRAEGQPVPRRDGPRRGALRGLARPDRPGLVDPDLPELRGAYVFADFSGHVWAVEADGDGARVRILDEDRSLTAVDVGPDGAVLLVDLRGEIVRLVHAPLGP